MEVNESKLICKICNLKQSQYKCPKCSVEYCSLTCFKDIKHSKCTEKFYQDQVKESLKSEKVSEFSDERDKMMKIIEKLRNLDDNTDVSDSSENESLLDALEEMDLKDFDGLSAEDLEKILGDKHLKKINELIENGVTKEWLIDSNIVKNEETEPSWFFKFKPSTIVLNEELPEFVPKYSPSTIPNLKKLLKSKPPSDFLWNNLLEITLIYSFVYDQFSREELEDEQVLKVEIVPIILELCASFHSKTMFMSAVEALESAKSLIDFNSYQHDMPKISKGTINLLSHPKMLLIMLMNLHTLFKSSSKNEKETFLAQKKVLFLAAWLEAEIENSKGSVDEILKTISNIVNQFFSE